MNQTIKQMFTTYAADRSDLEQRCEEYAQYTLPYMMPAFNDTAYEQTVDWQSIGARCVNHLSNRLMMSLFSPTQPFFRLDISDELKAQLSTVDMTENDIDEALAKAEKEGQRALIGAGFRAELVLLITHLVITGNGLVYFNATDKITMSYNLKDYIIRRDLSGKPIMIITRDRKALSTIPQEYQKYCQNANMDDPYSKASEVDLYTMIQRTAADEWSVTQSIEDKQIMEIKHTFKDNDLPWIPLAWKLPRGWDYGVGIVEEYIADFKAMSVLTESLDKGVAVISDIKGLVDPAGVTDVDEFNNADTGEYVSGREGDVSFPQWGGKSNDLGFIMQIIEWYERRVGHAFLLNSAVTRNAERVTAEEIRMQAQELDTSLGGVFSRLAEELQLPLAYLLMDDVDLDLNQDIEPMVITGLDSLSRMNDRDLWMMFFQDLAVLKQLPPELLAEMDSKGIVQQLGAAYGIDYNKVLLDEGQKKQNQAEGMAMNAASAGMEAGAVNAAQQ